MNTLIRFIVFIASLFNLTFAANFTIFISGLSYSPNQIEVIFGDTVTISASDIYPLVQVDKATWYDDGATPMPGGWGIKTSDYTFTVTTDEPIYFVCQNYVSSGMKGQITVQSILSVTNKLLTVELSLYPNPFSEYTRICLPVSEKYEVNIIDLKGQKILTVLSGINRNENCCFDFKPEENAIRCGTYFIQIITNRKSYLAKAIIRK